MLHLFACAIENDVKSEPDLFETADDPGETDSTPPIDTGTTTAPPPDEECNGVDDDGDGFVDEGWDDLDANGRADCMDVTCPDVSVAAAGTVVSDPSCLGTLEPVPDPWAVRALWTMVTPTLDTSLVGVASTPVVANLDDDNGDGRVDASDSPEVIVVAFPDGNYLEGGLVVIDGATGVDTAVTRGISGIANLAVGDFIVDGIPEIVAFSADGKVVAVAPDGTELWRSTSRPGNSIMGAISLADLDADGQPEVLADNLVLDGATGATLATLRVRVTYSVPVAADVDLDGEQEIVFGGALYRRDGTEVWAGASGQSMFSVLVQADSDDEAEVALTGRTYELRDTDGTLLASRTNDDVTPGPACAADFDADGVMEIAQPDGDALTVIELDGTEIWSVAVTDVTGFSGCAAFDVDGDGTAEVLYGDEVQFGIFAGPDGTLLYSLPRVSGTIIESPSVADIDHDDHAEILVTGSFGATGDVSLYALEHDGVGWPRSGPSWSTHAFSGTELTPDGAVPEVPDASWLTTKLFRGRPALDSDDGADLTVEIVDVCVADCVYGPAQVQVQVSNLGAWDVAPGTPMTIYAETNSGPVAVLTYALPAVDAGATLEGIVIDLTAAQIGEKGYTVRVDDDGTGAHGVLECDDTNNEASLLGDFCP